MSAKNRDKYQRWRCHTIAFRMSPEESRQLDIAVKLSWLADAHRKELQADEICR